jgi:hypothetical protein
VVAATASTGSTPGRSRIEGVVRAGMSSDRTDQQEAQPGRGGDSDHGQGQSRRHSSGRRDLRDRLV